MAISAADPTATLATSNVRGLANSQERRLAGLISIYRSKATLVAVMLLNCGFFFRSGSPFEQHPLAIGGVREVYLAVCCLCAAGAVATALRKRELDPGMASILVLGLAFPLGSAVLANLSFKQPLVYGLIEERRALGIFAFFFTLAVARLSHATVDELIGAVYWTALIYLGLSLVMQAGALGDLAARGIPELDPRKYRIVVGTEAYTLSIVIAAVFMIRFRDLKHWLPFLVGVAGLILVSQTRGAFLVCIASVIALVMLWRPASFILGALAAVGPLMVWKLFARPPEVSTVSEIDIRINTATIIVDEVQKNGGIGKGSLSLLWNGGFAEVYNKHFFLLDVGFVGEFYRFGILIFPLYILLGLTFWFFLQCCEDRKARAISIGVLVYMIVNAPGRGLLAVSGCELALLFAVASTGKAIAPRTGPLRHGQAEGAVGRASSGSGQSR
jgi:hypothetical protein